MRCLRSMPRESTFRRLTASWPRCGNSNACAIYPQRKSNRNRRAQLSKPFGRPTSSPRLGCKAGGIGHRCAFALRTRRSNERPPRKTGGRRRAAGCSSPSGSGSRSDGFSADAAITLHGRRVSGRGAVPRGAARCLGGSADLGRGGRGDRHGGVVPARQPVALRNRRRRGRRGREPRGPSSARRSGRLPRSRGSRLSAPDCRPIILPDPPARGAAPSSFQRIARLRFEQWGADGNGQAPGRRAVGDGRRGNRPRRNSFSAGRRRPRAEFLTVSDRRAVSGPALAGGGLPPPPGGGGTAERNLVVVGVNPGERIPQEIPRGQRAGSFSGGPEQGDGGGGTQTARLHVPNLTIGGRPRTKAAIAAGPAGSAVEDLQRLAAFRSPSALPPLRAAAAAPQKNRKRSTPTAVPRQTVLLRWRSTCPTSPAHREAGTAIRRNRQGNRAGQAGRARPPREGRSALHPRSGRGKNRRRGHPHGIIQPDGAMDKLQVIRGLDDRLDAGALAALSKWRFDPARNTAGR